MKNIELRLVGSTIEVSGLERNLLENSNFEEMLSTNKHYFESKEEALNNLENIILEYKLYDFKGYSSTGEDTPEGKSDFRIQVIDADENDVINVDLVYTIKNEKYDDDGNGNSFVVSSELDELVNVHIYR